MPNSTTSTDNALLTDISRKLDTVLHDLNGNGQMGLKQRMSRAESHLFHNSKTGDPGLVARAAELDKTLTGLRAQLRLLNWLLGFVGAEIGRASCRERRRADWLDRADELQSAT